MVPVVPVEDEPQYTRARMPPRAARPARLDKNARCEKRGDEHMTAKDSSSLNRRSFMGLVGLGMGATGIAAAMTGPQGQALAPVPAGPAAPGQAGYRETEHVRTYYELARH